MAIVEQRCMFCTVNKVGEHLASKAIFLGKEFEAQAQLLVDINHFKICDAEWEISKVSENISLGTGKASELIGVEAYFNINRVLGRWEEPHGGKRIKSLFFECVKALIQAETYVITERGFSGEEAYETYWHDREKDGCRYYSHRNPRASGWFDYVGGYKREGNLFNRYKNYRLIENDFNLVLQGTFSDSYHEMNAELCFDRKTGIIHKCELSVFRAPGSVCFENKKHGEKFVGKNFYTLTRRKIGEIVGGAQGCYHLTDLITDMIV